MRHPGGRGTGQQEMRHCGRAGGIFGYSVRHARARPNTTIQKLLTDDRYVGAVLRFLMNTRVGTVKEGASRVRVYLIFLCI